VPFCVVLPQQIKVWQTAFLPTATSKWREDTPIYLSATEYKLLIQFAHNVGKVMPAEELLSAIWGPQYRDDKEILWVSIARLRQKLEKDPHTPVHIVTRSGLGYLMPPVDD
jgi:DNA-binding response OmpR family regulator